MTNIITDENKVKGNWVKFLKVGDEIQGTYISKREVQNVLRGGKQTIYEIMKEDGEVWNVGSKPAIDVQMRYVKVGQIVGFKFIESRKNPNPGKNDTKIIQVFANSKVVNEKWLAEQEEQIQALNKEVDVEPNFTDGEPKEDEVNIEDEIIKLAKVKLGISNEADIKKAVMEKTQLAYIESNYSAILEKLRAL